MDLTRTQPEPGVPFADGWHIRFRAVIGKLSGVPRGRGRETWLYHVIGFPFCLRAPLYRSQSDRDTVPRETRSLQGCWSAESTCSCNNYGPCLIDQVGGKLAHWETCLWERIQLSVCQVGKACNFVWEALEMLSTCSCNNCLLWFSPDIFCSATDQHDHAHLGLFSEQ